MPLSRIDVAGALSALGYLLLLIWSKGVPDVHIVAFLGIMFAAWALLGLACTATTIPARKIWLWAIAFRVIGFFGQPILEDDWYRYLWDGAVFASSGNPYDKPPSAFFADPNVPARLQPILDGINNPDVPTIYAPICQVAFLISYWIAPGQLWPLKLILLGADLGALALLARVITGRRLLLYAWCPLLIKEVAFTAHPDILGIAFMVAGCTVKRPRTIAICCALAVGAKIFAGIVAGLLLSRLPKRHWLTFGTLLAGLYFPFWIQGSLAELSALKEFASMWEFNSTVFGVIAVWMGTAAARVVCAVLFLIVYATYAWRWKRDLPRGDWLFGAFFLLSSVVNPWYLLWLLPFIALFPSAAGIAALIIVTVAYVHGLNLPDSALGPYDHPWWVRVVEVITIFVAGSLQLLLRPIRQSPE